MLENNIGEVKFVGFEAWKMLYLLRNNHVCEGIIYIDILR